jgi:phage-related minor tail protein
MAQTIAIKIDVQDSGKISQLEQDLIKIRQRRSELNKLIREGIPLTDREAKELGELGTQATATANKINDLKNAVLKQNDAFKKSSGFVSGIKEGVGQWATSMIGVTAAIGGTIAVLKNISAIVTEFDQSLADVKAITGATAEEMVNFKAKILEVSASTGKGASDIAKAFQLVGSAQPELLSSADALAEVTKQAITLSQAGGLEVPEAAKALTLAMNQFGASADEAAMFTDVLASSQQKGTAEIFELAESLKNVGSVAKVSGLSFETTNAALQALAKGGLVGAEAGTKFRGVLLKLAATGRDELNPATTDLNTILNTLSTEVTDVTAAQKMFGVENAAAALTLIEQRNVVKELDGALNEHGAALDQAAIRTGTVNGSMEKLNSTWERTVLSIEDGGGTISQVFVGLINATEDFLNGIIKANQSFDEFKKETVENTLGAINESGRKKCK